MIAGPARFSRSRGRHDYELIFLPWGNAQKKMYIDLSYHFVLSKIKWFVFPDSESESGTRFCPNFFMKVLNVCMCCGLCMWFWPWRG